MWPAHVEKMRAEGLRASGSQGDFTVPVNAMHLTEAQNITEPFDYAFITVKSYDTEWATHFIKRYVKDDGAFVSIQNCWNDPTIASIVGPERQLGCIASHIEVALWEPGHVNRGGAPGRDHGHTVFRVGENSGQITARSEAIAAKLDNIDAAYATDNLWGERVGQAVPERDGQRHLGHESARQPGDGRRPSHPTHPHPAGQRGRAGRSGPGAQSRRHQRHPRRVLGRRRYRRRV